ncbi:uncharacterized protein LOC108220115 [Daucus carota subsp. sativus]|uniref:uncharacterized protein LOC108220115 n=1 Tax=Daucus carota subsp. sativus TaxID=79200 RepID=UPI0007EFF0A7|nr:PREDICTED: uncharacterized protein LOC108220115 [Daucus carota subsp. sativus]
MMAQRVQSDLKQDVVSPTHSKNSTLQHLKNGTEYLKASALQLEGNWKNHGTYIELYESSQFKVSGECELKAEEGPYVGHFLVGLARDHNMGKVKTKKSPFEEENEEDWTNHAPGMLAPISMGICDDEYVKFSLASAEPYWKMQKGLNIYGVVFTPLKKK